MLYKNSTRLVLQFSAAPAGSNEFDTPGLHLLAHIGVRLTKMKKRSCCSGGLFIIQRVFCPGNFHASKGACKPSPTRLASLVSQPFFCRFFWLGFVILRKNSSLTQICDLRAQRCNEIAARHPRLGDTRTTRTATDLRPRYRV